ncbi:MAG: hypothetical protein Athens071416_476 [Parcubacteria group bacterium Athens0714_16]|nr:MAG: hypothetical protein Athens071416_476 [Parcubacteria group bacterium Athens0714_16]
MSIYDLTSKIKGFGEEMRHWLNNDIFTIILIILVGFGGFGLGRLSVGEEQKFPISVENVATNNLTANALDSLKNVEQNGEVSGVINEGGQVVASKNGTKYHYPWCSGAKSINDKNKIFFASIEEAKTAGYSPASNCKGLK